MLVAEGYYPTLNNKWWDGYQSQKVVIIMEDVDKETVKFLPTTLRFGVLAKPNGFWGLEGVGGGRPLFFRTSLPLEQRPPFSITGALFRSERFYWSLRG